MSTVPLPEPRIGPLSKVAPKPIKFVLNWGRRYSLWVFNFGLACCAIEFIATSMSRHDFIRLGVIPFAPGPRQADLMVVSGTVSDKMAPAVKRLYEQMPEPKYVISFGACSNCGGPYWDSYCVTKGVDQIIPVDVYIPGCPPRPEALLHGIIHLQEKIAGESLGDRYTNGSEPVAPSPPVRPFSATTLRRPPVPPPPIPETLAHAEQQTLQLRPVDPDEDRSAGTVPLKQIPDAEAGPSTSTAPLREIPEGDTAPLTELPGTELPGTEPGGPSPTGTVPLRQLPDTPAPDSPDSAQTAPLTELPDTESGGPSPTGTVPLRELPDTPGSDSPDSARTAPLTELPDTEPGHAPPAGEPPPHEPPGVRSVEPAGTDDAGPAPAPGTPSASRGSPDADPSGGAVAGWTDPAAGTMPLPEVPETDPPASRATQTRPPGQENQWGRRARTHHLEDDPSIVPGLIEDDDEIGRSGR